MTPSHEPVGTVVAVGSIVDGWKIGDRIGALLFRHACGTCQGCQWTLAKEGRYDIRFCKNADLAGLKNDGAMAEYMIADAANAIKLPDSVSFEQGAPLMCAGVSDISMLPSYISTFRAAQNAGSDFHLPRPA
jgi:D-arabinose 1-dehydrogenase-like Zn-dependent alcohol dehydrogenase